MNYYQFVLRLTDALGDLQRDANLPITIPSAIELAEARCYRDLQLINASITQSTFATPNTRLVSLPTGGGTYISVNEVNVLTPVGATVSSGTRNPLARVSPRMISFLYPTEVSTGTSAVPTAFAMKDDQTVLMGASPGSSFTVEFIGTFRPTALSSGNSSTYLGTQLADLFFAASMSAVCYTLGDKAEAKHAYWEATYKDAVQSANVEEAKRKYQEYYTPTQPPAQMDTHGTRGMPG